MEASLGYMRLNLKNKNINKHYNSTKNKTLLQAHLSPGTTTAPYNPAQISLAACACLAVNAFE